MIDALAALLLLAADPPAKPPSATSAPVTVTAPAPDAQALARTAEETQDMYDQSCASREYGAYDDICDQLRKQVKEAKAAASRAARAGAGPK